MIDEELKPCPFCLNQNEIKPQKESEFEGSVFCLRCGSKGPRVNSKLPEWEKFAIQSWNFRGYT